MSDIVLNTNALRVLIDASIVDMIIRKGDHIFVAKCTWKKELFKGIHTHLINLFHESVRKLGKRFHITKQSKDILPKNLKKILLKHGADKCDTEIANLAYDRFKRTKQKARLVSNDSCFQNPRQLFNHYGICVKTRDKFKTNL